MRDSVMDLFDPRTAVMDSDNSSPTRSPNPDFAFAFNDSNFSDRVLRIEIVSDSLETQPESQVCHTVADWARKSKRHRGDVAKMENALDINTHPEEQILDSQQPDIDDDVGDENHDEEEIRLIEESPSGMGKILILVFVVNSFIDIMLQLKSTNSCSAYKFFECLKGNKPTQSLIWLFISKL
ncbi:BTB/POZ domain-containing protein POB1-like isoform X2 [Olea europaea var. sylvestris]|uniref:BTB/POZ domain-containing protein POB1-like isoform X2 n=1 Tax=Olea europaea var. sylvestris TaxID=158386 RepID=UPI000C1D446E|nr:BTB/POZ domain-containing protein POB1-like isoform X2 [Olea europaea var. sylvestris]